MKYTDTRSTLVLRVTKLQIAKTIPTVALADVERELVKVILAPFKLNVILRMNETAYATRVILIVDK